MTAPKRREHRPDPFVRAVDRYVKRGWNLPCDCPCHWWRGITEAIACCQMQGMAYIASEGTYMPWPDEGER